MHFLKILKLVLTELNTILIFCFCFHLFVGGSDGRGGRGYECLCIISECFLDVLRLTIALNWCICSSCEVKRYLFNINNSFSYASCYNIQRRFSTFSALKTLEGKQNSFCYLNNSSFLWTLIKLINQLLWTQNLSRPLEGTKSDICEKSEVWIVTRKTRKAASVFLTCRSFLTESTSLVVATVI